MPSLSSESLLPMQQPPPTTAINTSIVAATATVVESGLPSPGRRQRLPSLGLRPGRLRGQAGRARLSGCRRLPSPLPTLSTHSDVAPAPSQRAGDVTLGGAIFQSSVCGCVCVCGACALFCDAARARSSATHEADGNVESGAPIRQHATSALTVPDRRRILSSTSLHRGVVSGYCSVPYFILPSCLHAPRRT